MGGMRRSYSTTSLVVISDHTKMYDNRLEITEEGKEILHYTGMGKNGDQSLYFAQNKILNESNINGIKVYLFEKFKEEVGFTYRGTVKLTSDPYQEKQFGENGVERNVWMFPLELTNKEIVVNEDDLVNLQKVKEEKVEKEAKSLSIDELERLARRAKGKGSRRAYTTSYTRDPFVSAYAKRGANDISDLCEEPAQFNDKNGNPYLESHHIYFLSDSIENIVSLCVVCHKKQHVLRNPIQADKLGKKYSPENNNLF